MSCKSISLQSDACLQQATELVARVVSPPDKVALANIRGSGVWLDEPSVITY